MSMRNRSSTEIGRGYHIGRDMDNFMFKSKSTYEVKQQVGLGCSERSSGP